MSNSFPCLTVLVILSALAVPAGFSQAVSFNLIQNSHFSPIHADFNSDGREDFILSAGTSSCPLSAFGLVLSTSAGSYAPPVCYALPTGDAVYFAIGDFNTDGYADVIVADGNSTHLYEYLGSRTGKLHLQASFTAPAQVVGLAAADVNHDGKIDLVFGSATGFNTNQKLQVWFGNGHGGFTHGPSVAMPVQGAILVGDFDGDGNVDVFSQFVTFTTVAQVFYGDGAGHFAAGAPFSELSFFAAYDVNSDGRMDLITAPFAFSINGNTYYKYLKVYYGNASRTFTKRRINLGNCTNWSFPPAVADFNGDGVNDIVVVEASDCQGNGPDTVNVLLGNANGTYQPEQVVYSESKELLSGPIVLRGDQNSKPDFAVFDLSTTTSNRPEFLFLNTTIGNFPGCSPPHAFEGITLCAPTSTVVSGSPVQFSVGTANQAAGRKVEVWIDGKKRTEQLKHDFSYYGFLDASYTLSSGTHKVTVFSAGWDNLLQTLQFPLTVGGSCAPPASPGVNVCSPINASTVGNTVLAWAGGTVSGQMARMEVWVDGVQKFTSHGSRTLKTNLALASGTHKFVFYAVNQAGQKWTHTATATVP